ncbi:TetR/AcrR family transcriptional regulator [Umezawaea endophytica]|uniref:TetR/AcrR family transcriptional regulator n=1 Tax=Umezawaea endophytica TaxID=1654476 RepID=A0A9X3A1U6_9PSEU|nr:TetR/AcrR family transcriptional regulator [Umezawaea endophytica]MCS7480029.1 TetR/AcrR family transcriptional regulator [Umezawaea endophytica]
MIDSTIALIRRRGVHATGLTDLLSHSSTARQSIYQHFPGGKAELVEQATKEAGRQMVALLDTFDDDPISMVDGLIAWWEQELGSTDYTSGCPVVAAALAPSPAAGRAFSAWENRFTGVLVRAGVAQSAATSLATITLSALEGAIVLSRAAASTRPLDDVRTQLTVLIKAQTSTARPEPTPPPEPTPIRSTPAWAPPAATPKPTPPGYQQAVDVRTAWNGYRR